MVRIITFFYGCILFIAFATTSAESEPRKLWSQSIESQGIVHSLHILPEHNLALVKYGDAVAMFDLDTGAKLGSLVPQVKDSAEKLYTTDLAVSEKYVVALTQDGGGIATRRFFIFVYDAATRELLHQLDLPNEYPDHIPSAGTPQALLITGKHLLVQNHLRDVDVNYDPLMMQYDMGSGAFVRAVGLMELDATAEEGWFGSRPAAPDNFFHAAVAAEGMMFTATLPEDEPQPISYLSYDLNAGETGPALPEIDGEGRHVTLDAIDGNDLYYALSSPISKQNVVRTGSLVRAAKDTGEVMTTYEDPFSPDGDEMSYAEFIVSHISTGIEPHVGSYFPTNVSVSGGYVVASAPNAMIDDLDGVGALVVFDADTGEPNSLLIPETPEQDHMFGDSFAHDEDLVLISTQGKPDMSGNAWHEMVLYRLQ